MVRGYQPVGSSGCCSALSLPTMQAGFHSPRRRWLCHVRLIRGCRSGKRCCRSNQGGGEDDRVLRPGPRGWFHGERVVLCMWGMPPNDKAGLQTGWGGGRNMCSYTHTHTGYRLIPPTSSSLWFGDRSPLSVSSDVRERWWHTSFLDGGGV